MALDYEKMSKQILQNIGQAENLTTVNHCATRLRLGVKDINKINKSELSRIDGVLGVEVMPDQIQIIVGQIIEDLYHSFKQVSEFSDTPSMGSAKSLGKKKNIGTLFIDFLELVAKIMAPVIPALICAGFFH
ncbi:PTS transporter subunit EIIB [Lactobacillus panisapium]|uniref:PTS transporter subunit EIIB n=1 Tax=Lactobacillus panisapium TaxID=2012495 RepID=UPI001C695305|nr:PTS transporter subunit EIIB [Lactobacillus panisapium]QYN56916.1 PTS transporter subunit EIIB [Lactobacillus panisapium]